MGRRRIEMFQYRTVLAQLRLGASEREIARDHYMSRGKLAALRKLADEHGWLDARTPLPEDEQIAAALGAPKQAASTTSTLEVHRERIAGWLDQRGSTAPRSWRRCAAITATRAAIRRCTA
jgi:hypothetical protein